MMKRLRLTLEGEQVVADWRSVATEAQRRRLDEFVRTLQDGSWNLRWWYQPYASNPDVVEVRLDEHWHVFMNIVLDEDTLTECADIFTIFTSTEP
jgi:hypothetical protein